MASLNCQTFLLFLIVLFSFIQIGESISCYNCSEVHDSGCKDPYKKGSGVRCPFSDQVCVKHKLPSADLKVTGHSLSLKTGIIRGCKAKDYCTHVKSYSDYCGTCTSDLCNNSAQVTPSLIMLMIVSIKNYIV